MIDQPKSVEKVAAGDEVHKPKPGDFFLLHRNKVVARLIQFGQRFRYNKEESWWNHCGVFIDEDGGIAEALVRDGITFGNIDKYKSEEYIVVRVEASDEDRAQMLKFCKWAEHKRYGMLTNIGLAVWCILGGKFDISLDGTLICSGFVARTLERAGYIFEREPSHEMPADLARHFKVHRELAKKGQDD